MTINDLDIGQSGKIVGISSNGKIRRRLLDMGLTPSAEVTLIKKAPFGDPLYIHVRNYSLSIRISEAKEVQIILIK